MREEDYLHRTFGMRGRTALVTGAGRGIGLAIAHALGRAGARIVVNDIDAQTCADAVQSLAAEDIEACGACFDVCDDGGVRDASDRLVAQGWEVDILVSNAGVQNRKPLVDMTPAEWQGLLAVHVNGAFNCARTFIPAMIRRGFGRIVLTSAVAGEATMPHLAAYSTAKGALSALTRSLAVEYGAYGITANAIAPGFVRTEFTEALQRRPGFDATIRDSVPFGRWGSTEDVAPVVLFLVSPAANFVNGHVVAIDGGMLARL